MITRTTGLAGQQQAGPSLTGLPAAMVSSCSGAGRTSPTAVLDSAKEERLAAR
jgi:hypothetical protein